MEGWIKLHRKLLKWEWYKTPNMVHLFIHLILSANHQDGKWQGNPVKRGQLISGLRVLNKETGISIQSIRTCMEHLKSTGELTIQSTNKFSVITICNYEDYQTKEDNTNNQINTSYNKELTHNQHTTNNKQEYNNDNNDKKKEKGENEIFEIKKRKKQIEEENLRLAELRKKQEEEDDEQMRQFREALLSGELD